jgi:hypothetical protein
MNTKQLIAVVGAMLLVGCANDEVAGGEDDSTIESNLDQGGVQGPGEEILIEDAPLPTAAEIEEQDAAVARAAAKVVLPYTWQGQQTNYWCGPGSTRIAISTRVKSPPSQQTLATAMGTTTNGTNHIGLPAAQLNKYLNPGTKYVSRSIDWTATPAQTAQLKKDLVARISSGFPIVANVVSGWRPPGYPTSGTIYHYVAVVGYDANGDKALIADPAGGGAVWSSVPKTYWVSTSNLARWIGGKGYTG